MSEKELPYKKENAPDGSFSIVNNKGVAIAKTWNPEDADYICLCCNSHKELMGELRASDNWLHRLLKSCVIFLDDGEVTKRAVEKQSRYNQAALKGEVK